MFELLLLVYLDWFFPLSLYFLSSEKLALRWMRADQNQWPGSLFGCAGHLPCAGCTWVCSVTLTAGIFPDSVHPSQLLPHILLFRICPNYLFSLGGWSLLDQARPKIFWTLSSHLILACLKLLCIFSKYLWALFVVVALSFAQLKSIPTYTLWKPLGFVLWEKVTLLKAIACGCCSEGGSSSFEVLSWFLGTRHTFSISVENFICWWKSISHPVWIDPEQQADQIWLFNKFRNTKYWKCVAWTPAKVWPVFCRSGNTWSLQV